MSLKIENSEYVEKYQKQCKKILSEPEIRFAGIISEMGKLIAVVLGKELFH